MRYPLDPGHHRRSRATGPGKDGAAFTDEERRDTEIMRESIGGFGFGIACRHEGLLARLRLAATF